MKNYTNTGISLMILTTFLFSCMDGVSKYLAENNNVAALKTELVKKLASFQDETLGVFSTVLSAVRPTFSAASKP